MFHRKKIKLQKNYLHNIHTLITHVFQHYHHKLFFSNRKRLRRCSTSNIRLVFFLIDSASSSRNILTVSTCNLCQPTSTAPIGFGCLNILSASLDKLCSCLYYFFVVWTLYLHFYTFCGDVLIPRLAILTA